jgi:hypothetical protein
MTVRNTIIALMCMLLQGCCVGPDDLQPYKRDTGVFDPGGIRIRLDFLNSGIEEGYGTEGMARLARWIIEVWEEKDYPNLERLTECMSNQHIIIADDVIYERYCPPDSSGCMFYSNDLCGAVDGEIAWIAREHQYEEDYYGLFVHEMVHGAGGCGFGNSNADHDDERLWASISLDSVQWLAMEKEREWLKEQEHMRQERNRILCETFGVECSN